MELSKGDQVKKILINDEAQLIEVNTQVLDEPNEWVILVYRKVINKNTGKSKIILAYREVIKK